jgi:hypothetical protein
MPENRQIIYLRPDAPMKPEPGQRCNGCGVCCAIETCPVARVFLLQWRGPCRALQWQDSSRRYLCGMMETPTVFLSVLPARLKPWFRRCVNRWIASGTACDSNVEASAIFPDLPIR